MNLATAYALVALGSAIGGCGRFALASSVDPALGTGIPWGTILINITGCFLIGFCGTFFANDKMRVFLLTGICGGYTTFSAFSFQSLKLYENGRAESAAANIAISVILCMIAVWLGAVLARALTPNRV
jgi:CrcB protein